MKNKFPIILLVLFTIFAIIKIAFTNSMIYMEKKDYTTFEQTIGELKYSLDSGELDSLKFKYMDILFQINSLNVKQAGDSGENNPETKNIYGKGCAVRAGFVGSSHRVEGVLVARGGVADDPESGVEVEGLAQPGGRFPGAVGDDGDPRRLHPPGVAASPGVHRH